jgi:hypothetical protein
MQPKAAIILVTHVRVKHNLQIREVKLHKSR